MSQNYIKAPSPFDTYHSLYVLVVYFKDEPTRARPKYSKYKDKERSDEEQLAALCRLIEKYQHDARTMILFFNHKKGTGKHSDLPANAEIVRISNYCLNFYDSCLSDNSIEILRKKLQPLLRPL